MHSVSYCPYCKPEKLFKTGWKAFVNEHVDAPHIRLYKLQKGTRIANALQNSCCVVAVVVNCEDSYQLDPEQLHDITIPLIVVRASEGKELYDILRKYNVGDIQARIEIESEVDISTVQQPEFRMEKQPSDYQSRTEVQTEQPCSTPGAYNRFHPFLMYIVLQSPVISAIHWRLEYAALFAKLKP